jgi:hypothetical protein
MIPLFNFKGHSSMSGTLNRSFMDGNAYHDSIIQVTINYS